MPLGFSTLKNTVRFRPQPGVQVIRTLYAPEAASSDFELNELLVVSTSSGVDYVTHSVTKPSSNDTVSSSLAEGDLILGFAGIAASGTTGTRTPYIPAEDVDILCRLYNATSTSAEVQDVAIGDKCEFFRYRDTGADDVYPVVSAAPNATDGINKGIIVGRYSLRDGTNTTLAGEQGLTDTYGLVWVRLRPTLTVAGR